MTHSPGPELPKSLPSPPAPAASPPVLGGELGTDICRQVGKNIQGLVDFKNVSAAKLL